MSPYNKAQIILATKHGKEAVIRQPFLHHFNASIFVPPDFDTDQFGTFTGEIARVKTAFETVIEKAKVAATNYGFDYAMASEGSFGPHPAVFFAPGNVELMSFIDLKNDITVVESILSNDTNYAYIDITSNQNYDVFLKNAKFPSHAIIVKSKNDNVIIQKGIQNIDTLNNSIRFGFSQYNDLRLETDMRAMMNPTRLSVIEKLAVTLVNRLKNICIKCQAPGFGKVSFSGNLLCEYCGTTTSLYEHKLLSCLKCDYQEILPRDDLLKKSDPKYCHHCNP